MRASRHHAGTEGVVVEGFEANVQLLADGVVQGRVELFDIRGLPPQAHGKSFYAVYAKRFGPGRPGPNPSLVPQHRFAALDPVGEVRPVSAFDHRALDLQGRREEAVVHRPDVLDQYQKLQALVLVERQVDLFEQVLEAVFQIATAAIGDLLAADFGEHTERHRLGHAIADHAHLLDARMHGQAVFDRRRGDIFALAGLEDFLDPPGQAQVAFGILFALVAGTQETVGGDGFRGFLRILVITLHGRATAHLHLAILGDAHLHTGAVLADPALLELARPADMGIAAVLGHAIDLEYLQPQALVPVEQGLRHGCGARQGITHRVQAKTGEHLVADQAPDQRQLEQEVEPGSRHLAVHPHLELGPDPRHAEDHRRPGALEIVEEGLQALGEEDRLPRIDRCQLDEHALSHMTQRQVGQDPIVFTDAEQLR